MPVIKARKQSPSDFPKNDHFYPLIRTRTLGTCYRYVLKSWGYFLWNNRFLYLATDDTETSPKISIYISLKEISVLTSVVNRNEVKTYINGVFLQKVELERKEEKSMIRTCAHADHGVAVIWWLRR